MALGRGEFTVGAKAPKTAIAAMALAEILPTAIA